MSKAEGNTATSSAEGSCPQSIPVLGNVTLLPHVAMTRGGGWGESINQKYKVSFSRWLHINHSFVPLYDGGIVIHFTI